MATSLQNTVNDVSSAQQSMVYLGFTILPQGASAPLFGKINVSIPVQSVALNKAQGVVSVTRSGTGVYVVNLLSTFKKLIAGFSTLQLATSANRYANITSQNVTAVGSPGGTITITVTDSTGTPQDITANANNAIHCRLVLDN
jgi:hypothetical protein